MRFIKDELSLILKTILTLNVWNTKNIQIHHLINVIFIIFWWHTSWYFAIPLLCTRFVMCVFTLWIKDTAKDRRASYLRKKTMNLYLDIGLIIMQQFLGGKHFKKVREKNIFIYVKNIKRKRILIIVFKCNATEVLLQHKFCLCLCIYLIYKTIQLMKIIF